MVKHGRRKDPFSFGADQNHRTDAGIIFHFALNNIHSQLPHLDDVISCAISTNNYNRADRANSDRSYHTAV